jgi:hypothetical protein
MTISGWLGWIGEKLGFRGAGHTCIETTGVSEVARSHAMVPRNYGSICGPSLASGSMTTTLAEGKSLEDAAALRQKDILDALQGLPKESEHCALLAVNTLRVACEEYLKREKERP